MEITVDLLRRHRAYPNEIAIVAAEWPEGCEVSEANLLRAGELGLNLDWFADLFLPPLLRAAYQRQDRVLLIEYDRQVAAFGAEHERQKATLWAETRRLEAALIWKLWSQAETQIEGKETAWPGDGN